MDDDVTVPPGWTIETGQAQLWLDDPGRVRGPLALRLACDVLSDREQARMRRMPFSSDRGQFLTSRALLRTALSACVPAVTPHRWRFRSNRYGRPELPTPWQRLRFNVSHTAGLVACVVVVDLDCGIDVERVTSRDFTALTPRALAEPERTVLTDLPPAQRSRMFMRYWTLKEAYVKARGRGMSLPLEECVFAVNRGQPRLLSHPPDDHPCPDGWQFLQTEPTGEHVLAVALRTAGRAVVRVRWHGTAGG